MCCGFSPACLRAWVAPSSHNKLSTLQTGFSHNSGRITEKIKQQTHSSPEFLGSFCF